MIFQTTRTTMEIPRKKMRTPKNFFLRLLFHLHQDNETTNYNHWIHRSNENNHCCLQRQQKIATGGNDDFSNSVKHVILNHPEISAF